MKNNKTASLSLRKLLLSVLVTAPLATLPVPLWALPASQSALDSQISSTSGATATWNSATSVTVNSTTTNSIVRWINFGATGMTVASGDTITYNMPSSSSSVLNTVTGGLPTVIDGTLTTGTNGGSIWVQNPNGITVSSTGVINATNIGLSTVPESEFYFAANGKLEFTENTSNTSGLILTSSGVLIDNATLTAASGTGNVWIAGKGVSASGTIDAGNATITGFQGGTITLAPAAGVTVPTMTNGVAGTATASGGALTIGDVTTLGATLNVTQTSAGTIAIDANQNLTVYGPSVSLNSKNGVISQPSGTGTITIGNGATTGATLTTNSGTSNTTISKVQSAGTGVLNVTATGAAMTVIDPNSTGKLAISATGTSLTTSTGGDLTLNAGNVSSSLSATSTNGSILSGGTMIVGSSGTIALSATTAGKNITFHEATGADTQAFTIGTNATGSVTLTADAGTLLVPSISAKNITVSAGNVTVDDGKTVAADAAAGTVWLTATAGNVSLGKTAGPSTLSGKNVTVWASDSVKTPGAVTVTSGGKVSVTGNSGNVDTTSITIGGSPTDVTLVAGKAITIAGAGITAGNVTATAGTTLTQSTTVNSLGANTGTLSYTAGKDITLNQNIGNSATFASSNISTTGGNVAINFNIYSGNASVSASGNIDNPSAIVATGGTVTVNSSGGWIKSGLIDAGNVTLTALGNVELTQAQNGATKFQATSTSGDVLQSGTGTVNTAGNVWLTANAGNVTVSKTINAGNLTISSGAKTDINAAVTVATGGTASITAGGNVGITAALSAPKVSITGASINTGPVAAPTGSIIGGGSLTLSSTGNITLNNAANNFATVTVTGAPSDALIVDSVGVTVGKGTNTTGNLTLTAPSIALGTAASDTITVGKALSLTSTAGAITDASDNITVLGALNLASTGGAITLNGNAGTTVGLNSSYGQVNVSAAGGAVTIYENTTLNLGTLTLGSNALTAYSKASIVNSGVITTSGAVLVGAGTASAPGTINLDFNDTSSGGAGTNKISGSIGLLTNLYFFGSGSLGNYLASKITVVNNATSTTNLFSLTGTTDVGVQAVDVDLTTTGTTQLVVGTLATNGTVNLTAGSGGISAPSLTVSAVTVKSGGAVSLINTKALTVNGNISGTGTASYTASAGDLTIGSYVSGTTGATTFAATDGKVTDSVTGIGIYGPVAFNGKSVSVTKAGHSFGAVSVNTAANNGDAAIVESGYLNLGTINTGTGAFTGSSTNGGVLQSGSLTAGNVTVSALQGTVSLNNAANAIGGTVTATSMGNLTIVNNAAIKLGSLTTNGNLSVDTSTASGNITQASGSSIYSYGATSFKSATTGAILLTNSGNQFGGLTLTTGSGAIKVTEQTTLNLKAVNTSGSLDATSTAGAIVDSQAADADINVGGTATLTASSINISKKKATIGTVIGNATAGDFTLTTGAGLIATVNATGNATINPTGALVFGNSTIGGDLAVHGGTTTIAQNGPLNVAGNVTLWGTGFTLNDATNQFGPVQLHNSSAALTTSITESGTFNLRAGSVSQGQVVITTGGDFVTSGTGGSSFTGGAATNATTAGLIIHAPNGTITFGTGSVVVTTGLTVDASGTKDLSLLSKAGNLNGIDPFNLGTGTLVPPAP